LDLFFTEIIEQSLSLLLRAISTIHKTTLASSIICLYGHCCRHRLVSQRVVSDISVVCSRWSICSLCSEFNNANLLLRLLVAAHRTSILLHMPNIAWPTIWRRYLVTTD